MSSVKSTQQVIEEDYLNGLLTTDSDAQGEISDVVEKKAELNDHGKNQNNVSPSNQTSNSSTHKNEFVNTYESIDIRGDPRLPFMGQLFKAAGVKLALPVSSFSHVLACPDRLLPCDKSNHYLFCNVQDNDRLIEVVDLTRIVIPANRLANDKSPTEYIQPSNIIVLQNGISGIACDELLEMIKVDPDSVCWRDSLSERKWLAGTVKSDGYAILDVNGILQLLN